MEKETVGLVVFVVLTLVSGVSTHYFIRSYFAASILAAGLTTVMGQVAFRIHSGYWDPFLIVSSVTMVLLAFLISLVVGFPFYINRRRK